MPHRDGGAAAGTCIARGESARLGNSAVHHPGAV